MSIQPRYAQLNLVLGTNGTGKSTFTDEKVIARTGYKNILVYIEPVDTAGAPFKAIPVIDDYSRYAGGKACISSDSIEFTPFIQGIEKKYRNGLLIIDEAGEYSHDMFPKGDILPAVRTLFKQKRKYNVETYLIYHSASEVPVKLFKWVNNVILFHQTDKFNHKGAVIPRIDELNAAKDRIQAKYLAGNKYAWECIKLS